MFSHIDLLFSTTCLEGPEQMALDEVLLGLVERPILRVYRWKSPCVTFGYFQKYDLVKGLYPNDVLVRRWSGGGCVEHREDFTFSLMLPETEAIAEEAPSLFYRRLHEGIVAALRQHGIEARLASQQDQLTGASCFLAPCPCDVMLDQKKIVGGAQRRSKGRLLYQGSIQVGDRRWKIEGGRGETFFRSLAEKLSSEVSLIEEKKAYLEEAHQLGLQKYRSKEWQEKR